MQLILLAGLIVAGFLLAKINLVTPKRIQYGNTWIINVALPAVALKNIPFLNFSSDLLAPIISPMLLFGCSALFFFGILGKWLKPQEKVVLTVLGGLGNTSFMGYPMLTFFYEESYLSMAVVFDQATFLMFSTAAQYVIASQQGNGLDWKRTAKKILTFPPLIGLVVGALIPKIWLTDDILMVLGWIGWTITPVAMMIVGYQIARFVDFNFTRSMYLGLIYKLILAPVIVLLFVLLLGVSDEFIRTCTMEAAMAPMITASILLSDNNFLPKLTSQVLCWGILFSFITASAWYGILEML